MPAQASHRLDTAEKQEVQTVATQSAAQAAHINYTADTQAMHKPHTEVTQSAHRLNIVEKQ